MTFAWTPHESEKDCFICQTGKANIKASVAYYTNSWLTWITIGVHDAHTHIKTWHACKDEAMAVIEQRLNDLLPIKS